MSFCEKARQAGDESYHALSVGFETIAFDVYILVKVEVL